MEINEAINEGNEGFTNSLQKPKKPRSEKQIEALKKAQIKRKENIEKRKKEKADSISSNESYEDVKEENLSCNKVGVPNSLETAIEIDPEYEEWLRQKALSKPKPVKRKPKKKVIYQEPEDSSSEEEIIYVPAPKKKKKKKKVVVQAPEQSSSEEEVYEPEPAPAPYYDPPPSRQLRYSDVFQF